MNVAAKITALIFPEPVSKIAALIASVLKPDAMVVAELELIDNAAAYRTATARLTQISERLDYRKIAEPVLFKSEQDTLEAERTKLNRKIEELQQRATVLRRQIAATQPEYAAALSRALAPSRWTAAEQLIEAIRLAEAAIGTIKESNTALLAAGMSPPRAFALPYADAVKALANKVMKESALAS